MELPLKGVRVLDLSRALSGPYCTMVLADLGAEVTKVEPAPEGDLIRLWGPRQSGVALYYLTANRNKRSLMVDFRAARAMELLGKLADRSDVVIENFRPGVMNEMGLDYEVLCQRNPGLIYGSISGFGLGGPKSDYPGFDIIAQAVSGLMSINGERGGDPLRVGVPLADIGAGMWLVVGILAALRQRDQTGIGQRVDTSLLATLVNMLSYHAQGYLSLGIEPKRTGNEHPVIHPYGAYQAADGLMVIAPATPDMWTRLCSILGVEQLTQDERFAEPAQRQRHSAQLKTVIEERLATDTAGNWAARMIAAGIAAAPIQTVGQAMEDPQVASAGLIESIEHPLLGPIRMVANPFRMSAAPSPQTTRQAPPQPGEHSAECLRAYGFDAAQIDRLMREGVVQQDDGQESEEHERALATSVK